MMEGVNSVKLGSVETSFTARIGVPDREFRLGVFWDRVHWRTVSFGGRGTVLVTDGLPTPGTLESASDG